MNKFKRFMSLVLVLCMVMAFVPVSASAAEEDFLRVYHVDCGRKYFTVDQIEDIIDLIAENDYTHLELAIGNEGLRLILDDMTVGSYSSEAVTEAIKAGNAAYSHSGEWTEAEMDGIIEYAASKGIEIIPLLNTPGHMTAILSAMQELGMTNCGYSTEAETSERTVSMTNAEALAFTKALVSKYVAYFDAEGCTYFNLGADEYANDILDDEDGLGFGYIQSKGHYDEFVTYINDLAQVVVDAGMTPIAFNDGLYYANDATTKLNENLMVAYWSAGGWGGLQNASASFIAGQGHKILNTNELWYYVLGRYEADDDTYSYEDAVTNTQSVPVTRIQGDNGSTTPAGAMMCLWCDEPSAAFGDTAMNEVTGLVAALANNNSDYFVVAEQPTAPEASEPVEDDETTEESPIAPTAAIPEDAIDGGTINLTIGGEEPRTISGVDYSDDWSVADDSIVFVEVEPETLVGETYWELVTNGAAGIEEGEEYLIANTNSGSIRALSNTGGRSSSITVSNGKITTTVDDAYIFTFEKNGTAWNIKDSNNEYLYPTGEYSSGFMGFGAGWDYSLTSGSSTAQAVTISGSSSVTISRSITDSNQDTTAYIRYNNNNFSASGSSSNLYLFKKVVIHGGTNTNITFTGLKPGTTTVTVGNYVYTVNVDYKAENVTMVVDSTKTFTQTASIEGDAAFTTSGIVSAAISGNTVTFTALKVGTTVATVGNTKYTINVVEEDLTEVADMKVQWWITNLPVTTTDDNITPDGFEQYKGDSANDYKDVYHTLIQATEAYGKDGIELSTVVPATGTSNPTADEPNEVIYWKGVALDEDNQQDMAGSNNKTHAGTNFYYIRYYSGAWAVSADRITWVNVTMNADGTQSDQLVAYYLQKTQITNQNVVQTEVVDWGPIYGEESYGDTNFVALDFAVKYEDGTRNPDGFAVSGKTIMYHCDYNNALNKTVFRDSTGYYRRLGTVRATESENYEVYMITLTPSSDSYSTKIATKASNIGTYTYSGTEKVVWVDDVANLGKFEDTDLQHADFTVGGEPTVEKIDIYNQQAMLVTYYVRAKVTPDALTVHYIDEAAGNVQFYTYNIAVAQGTYFAENIQLPDPWKGDLVNGTVQTIDPKVKQTVSSDLATLPAVAAQYLYSEYKCVRIELEYTTITNQDGTTSEVPKDLYLYYTFDPTVTFVADFGLPLEITAKDLNPALEGIVESMTVTGGTYSAYGRLTSNGTSITYEPYRVMQGSDFFTILVTTTEASGILDETAKQVAFRVYVVPATTVYYEEGFAAYTGNWDGGSTGTGMQETHLSDTCDMNYGYTAAYTAAGATNGTEAVSSAAGNKAEFTFTGTGVEIYANCTTATGTLIVQIRDTATNATKKLYQVDTKAKDGIFGATDNQEVDSYSLPIVSAMGLPHGTYKVIMQHTGAAQYLGDIKLDGFRVHNTLNNLAVGAYDSDEMNPTFLELRNAVLTGLDVTPGSVNSIYETAEGFLSQVYANEGSSATLALLLGNEELNVQDLLDNGPKNELFLWPGESLTFNLGSAKAQIGLKALNGTVTYNITDGTANATPTLGSITTSADMFYHDLTGTIVIKNTHETNVLSVTKLKMFGQNAALQNLTVEDVAYTLSVLGYTDGSEKLDRPGAPIANPFADVTEGSFYYDAVLWAVGNGITTGADDRHFLPEAICQRAAVVTFLWRAAGCPEPETTVNPFVDVTEGDFYYKAVLWALEKGITTGIDGTHFAPYAPCSRAQVVTFLWRAEGCPAAEAVNPFVDVTEGEWYYDAVLWALENSVTTGMSDSIFGVENICNRAQIVTFLYRAR